MKRIVTLLIAIALVFTFTACGDKADAPSDQSFVKPENYSTILLVTVNPQFRLYLDEQDNVLAVEPVNEDAQTVVKDTEFNGKLESVIEKIVNKTNEAGFVKENATFDLKIVETKKEHTKAETILNTAKDTASRAFEKIDITVEIKTSISENVSADSDTDNTATDVDASESAGKNDVNSDESRPESTQNTSLVNSAESSAPKAFTSLDKKNGSWTVEYVSDKTYYSAKLTLVGKLSAGVGIGDPLSEMEPEVQDDIRKNKDQPGYKESYVVYNGKEYWSGRGSSTPLAPISENGNTITLTSSQESGAQIVLTRTDENTLTVKSCTQTFKDMIEDIPVGTKFKFKAN